MKKYNSEIHGRRSIRLKGYDYSKPGSYFVTTNVHEGNCMFGEIVDEKMILNDYGTIANQQCELLPTYFTNIEMVQEQERGITITSAATTCFWKYRGNQFIYYFLQFLGLFIMYSRIR